MAVIKIKYAANKVASLSLPKFSGGTAGDMIVAGELAFGGSSPTTAGVLVIGTGSQDANAIIGGSAFFDQTIANYIGGTAYGKTGTGSNVLATGPTLSGAVSITGASASLTVGTVSVYVATTLYGNLTVGGTTVTLADTTTIKGTGTTASTAVLTIQPGNAVNGGTLAVSGNLSVSSTIVTLADTTTIKGTSGTGVLNIWPGNAVNAGTLAVSGNLSVSGNLTGGLKVLSSTLPQVTLSNTASEYLTIGVNTTGGATFTTVSATAESARPPFKFVGAGLNSPYLDTYFVRGIADNTLTPASTEYTLAISAGDITLGASASGPYTGALSAAGLISAGSFSTTGAINAGSINVSEVQTAKLYIGTTQVNLNQASGTVEYLNGMLGIGVEQLKGAPTLENEINATAASNRIANKGYVDSVAAGLHIHAPADLILLSSLAGAITNESTITYYNGISSNGVGATLTISAAASTSLIFSIDGVAVVATNRIIIAGETDESQKIWHGIYTVTAFTGAVSASIVLTRASDADTISDLSGGDFIFVTSGTVYADSGFVQTTNPGTFTLGTTFKPVFVQFSSAGDIIAGAGLSKSGGAISVELTTNGGLAITGNSITGTLGINTSIAGSGLSLTNGVLSVNSVALGSGVSGTLPVSNGGTGSGTALTAWSVLYASSATAAVSTNAGAANTVLTGQASAAPSFSSTPTLGRLTLTEVAAAAGTTALTVSPANHTAVTAETPAFSVAANTLTITTGFPNSGATSVQRFNRFTAPTITSAVTSLTVATAATVAITNAPTASSAGGYTPTLSASYALLVEAGDVLFKGLIKAGSGATPTALTDTAGKILTAALNTVGVAQGGTGVGTFAANGVLYGNSASAISVTAAGAANTVLTGQGSGAAPSFSSTPTLGRLTLTDTATTSGATLVVTPGARSSSGSENTSGITVATNTLTISANNTGLQRFNVFTAPTIAASAGSLSVATSATVSIAGAPISGTNTPTLTSNFALLVEAGDVGFKGIIKAGSGLISITDSTGKLSLGSSTVTGTLPVTSGGTGLSSGYVLGDMLYVSANTPTIARLPIMSTGYILAGGTIPGWTSTPQVAQLYLNSTSNQLVYTAGAGGYFGTLSWPSVTIANKTITLPDLAGTVMLTSGTQTIGIGVAWNGTIITPAYGGTGVDNGVKTITLVGNFATAGAGTYATTLTVTAATNVTLPTSGTLATTAYVDSVAQGLHVHPPADVILTQTLANVISNELSFVYNGSTIIITGTTANNLIFSADAIPVADVPIGNLAAAATTATTLTFSNTVSNTWPYSIDSSGVWLFDIPIGTPIIGSSIATGTVTTSAIVTGDLASTVNLTISKALTAPITAGAANYSFVIGWTRIVIAGETVTTASTMVPNKEWHGIYTKTTTTNTSITLTRAIDADVITDLSGGDFIFIQRGQQYSDTGFVQTASTILTGVFANANGFMPVFVQFSQAGIILAGDGLAKTGNILKVVGTANSITVASGGAVSVSTTYAGGTYITTVGTVATGTIDGGTF